MWLLGRRTRVYLVCLRLAGVRVGKLLNREDVLSVADLFVSWSVEIDQLVEPPVDKGLGAETLLADYEGMQSTRDGINEALTAMPDDLRQRVAQWVDARLDRRFRDLTEPDSAGLLVRADLSPVSVDDAQAQGRFWFARVPRRGLMRAAMEEVAERPSS